MDKIKAALNPNRRSGSIDEGRESTSPRLEPASPRHNQDTSYSPRTSMDGPRREVFPASSQTASTPRSPVQQQSQQLHSPRNDAVPPTRTREHATPTKTASTSSGHGRGTSLDMKSIANALESEDHRTLKPVIQETIHHHETEEVTRVKMHDRHVHHIQHHVQPLIERVDKPELHTTHEHPVTYTTSSTSGSSESDAALLALLASGPRHEEKHVCYERVRIDKGEQIRETVHYHVHNIIQPVIYRDRPVPSTCHRSSTAASNPTGTSTGRSGHAWGPTSLEKEVLRERDQHEQAAAQGHQQSRQAYSPRDANLAHGSGVAGTHRPVHGSTPGATQAPGTSSVLSEPSERAGPATKEAQGPRVVGAAI